MNLHELNRAVADGWLTCRIHPQGSLRIYNYSQRTQWESNWNEITLSCRGLIVGPNGDIVARPFRKFFNLEEVQNNEIPNEPFDVFTKLDGSLGILYWYRDKPAIATRGSFDSPQAIRATEMLKSKYGHCIKNLDPKMTYLFEIIYPENRIVVDYCGQESLTLLGIVETNSGNEHDPCASLGFPVVEKHDGVNDFEKLSSIEKDNFEGFVIRFRSGYRLKVKLAEYKRLHKIMTGVSNVAVWECLRDGRPFDDLLDSVPDEFNKWLRETIDSLRESFALIENNCKSDFRSGFASRKDAAEYFKGKPYPSILFSMLDGKPYSDQIWKIVRPVFAKPFNTEGAE